MLNVERENQIIDILKERKNVTVKYLCRRLYVSEATVRRDLARLEDVGALRRVRGGAALIEGRHKETPVFVRNEKNTDKKEVIARLAMPYVKQATTLFMDASSTVCEVAKLCTGLRDVSIVTNGLDTLNILTKQSGIKVYSTGGVINNSALLGNFAVDTLNSLYMDLVLFSCCGISEEQGITEASEDAAAVKVRMLGHAKKKILLCDSSKFDMGFFCRVCNIDDIDVIITDRKPDGDFTQNTKTEIIYPK